MAVPGNIGPRSFLYGPRCARSVLSRPRANIPQYGPRARLVRGYYYFYYYYDLKKKTYQEQLHKEHFFQEMKSRMKGIS